MYFSSYTRALVSALSGLLLLLAVPGPPLYAQETKPANRPAVNATIGSVGLSIGDSRRVTGIRLNYRDRRLRWAHGLNVTVWYPYEEASATINGIALGVPLTGATRLRGLGVGAGLVFKSDVHGIAIAPVGVGSGEGGSGILIGGLGAGTGGPFTGLLIGGLGAGAGERTTGILIGGLGAGTGGTSTGIVVGGLGAGVGDTGNGILISVGGAGTGDDASGALVGGLAAGAGDRASGLLAGGLGAGAGDDANGILVGGLGVGAGDQLNGIGVSLGAVGAGDRLTGLGVGGLAVGAGQGLRGVALSGLALGSSNITGLSITGGYTRVEDGRLKGVSIGGVNDVRGAQHGLTIGVFNYARSLNGAQIGLVNVAKNNPKWATVLPILNLNL